MLPTQTPWKKLLLRLGSNSLHPGSRPHRCYGRTWPSPLGLMTQVVGCFASIWDKDHLSTSPAPEDATRDSQEARQTTLPIPEPESQLARLSAWLPHERRGRLPCALPVTSEWEEEDRPRRSVGRAPSLSLNAP